MRFIEKECEEDIGKKIEVREFCNFFNNYLKSRHLRVKTPLEIKKMMKNEGFEDAPRKILEGAEMVSKRFFINITLKTTNTTETTEISSQNTRGDMTSKNGSIGSFCSFDIK